MQFVLDHLLTLITFIPLLGSAVVMLMPRTGKQAVRWVTFVFSLAPFLLAVVLWISFQQAGVGFQFEEQVPWFPLLNSTYHLGVDGISLPMVLLTTLLTPLAILRSCFWTTSKLCS